MDRPLCPVETLYVGQRSRAVLSTALRGLVDVKVLSAAFDAVTEAHPSLRSRIVGDGTGFALSLLAEDERPRLITRTGEEQAGYVAELNTPLTVGGPVSRAALVSAPDGDSHLLVVSLDHAVTDGHSALALQNEIWDRYRALVEGGADAHTAPGNPDEAPAWPQPVSLLVPDTDEAHTAAHLKQRIEDTRQNPVELVAYDAPGDGSEPGRIEVCRLTLDEERTTRLRRTARQEGVSVHALICAALLTAARRRLPGSEPRTLGCMSPVDLRTRLSPPLPASVMVPAVTSHVQTLKVTADAEPLALARTVHTRLTDFVAGSGRFHELRIMPEIPRNPTLQLATVIATNMGVSPGPRPPAGLRATDVRLVPAREQYFPQAGRSPIMACAVSVEGRLAIEFPHFTACFSPSFVRNFRDEVLGELVAFADAAEPAGAPSS